MTKLSRAISSTAHLWVVQGLHPNGRWHDLFHYQDTPAGALQAKVALNHCIMMDDGEGKQRVGYGDYEDFRLAEPVPAKTRKKARRVAAERRQERLREAEAEAIRQGSNGRSGRSDGAMPKARRGKKSKTKAKA